MASSMAASISSSYFDSDSSSTKSFFFLLLVGVTIGGFASISFSFVLSLSLSLFRTLHLWTPLLPQYLLFPFALATIHPQTLF